MKGLAVGLSAMSLLLCGSTVFAAFPDKPVVIAVGRSPGGSTDVIARTFAPFFSKYLKTPVVVQNVQGAGGQIALREVYNSKPDGYELILSVFPSDVITQVLKRTSYDMRKFIHIYGISGRDTNGIIVPYDSQFKSFPDLLKASKESPISLSSTQIGSNSWLLAILLRQKIGFKYRYVAYEGGGESVMALVGGHVTACVSNTIDFPRLAKEKRIRVLAVASSNRVDYLPDVPTFKELGYPSVITNTRQGIAAPPGLPSDIKKVLSSAAAKAVVDPEFLKIASSFTVDAMAAEQMQKEATATYDEIAQLLKEAGEIK